MALYVDSAYIEEIAAVARIIPLAGVTTNPSILLNAQQHHNQAYSPQEVLIRLLRQTNGTIFMQPSIANEEQAYREAVSYIHTSPPRVMPKIPMTQMGIQVARRLKDKGYRLAFTAVSTVAQAYCAAMLQADFVIIYFNRLQRSGVNVYERIDQMNKIFQSQQLPTRIMAASIKSTNDATMALSAGAHDLTVPPDTLLEMITDPESEDAVARFQRDWQEMKIL